jgi:hypothetical protein
MPSCTSFGRTASTEASGASSTFRRSFLAQMLILAFRASAPVRSRRNADPDRPLLDRQ